MITKTINYKSQTNKVLAVKDQLISNKLLNANYRELFDVSSKNKPDRLLRSNTVKLFDDEMNASFISDLQNNKLSKSVSNSVRSIGMETA